MSDGKPGRGSDQFPLRLPDGMRDRIKAMADAHARSMNAQIVAILETALPPASRIVQIGRAIAELTEQASTATDVAERRRLEINLKQHCVELQDLVADHEKEAIWPSELLDLENETPSEQHITIHNE